MKTYARIDDGRVAELFDTAGDIKQLFHPSLIWVDVTAQPAVQVGWCYDGRTLGAPAHTAPAASGGMTILEMQRQLVVLTAQIETLMRR